MYSLIIVEDEFTTRRALIDLVPWEKLGFKVCGEFADGHGVLEYLKSNNPDVILTDIKMTNVDGLEIARFVKEHNIPTRVVFLSAHGEFSFAQEAIGCGVDHYLLKPIDLSKLKSVFSGMKIEMDKQSVQVRQQKEKEERYNKLVSYEKQQLITDLYFGSLKDSSQLSKRLELIDAAYLNEKTLSLYLIEVALANNENYRSYIDSYGQQVLQEQVTYILGCIDKNIEFYPIIWNEMDEATLKTVGVLWVNAGNCGPNCNPDYIQKEISAWTSLSTEIPVFKLLRSFEDLSFVAEQIVKSESQDVLVKDVKYLELIREQGKLLCSYLLQNKLEQGIELSSSLIDNCSKGGCAFAQRQAIYTIYKLIDEIAQNNLLHRNQLSARCITEDSFGMMRSDALKEWFLNCVRFLFEAAEKQEKNGEDKSVKKIMTYLREHYNEDITLNIISENVFLNPTYISRLIKKELGKNYSEILMELRIEHAVELLRTTEMYVYDIAEKVGYANLKYFYKVFRKITGKSPNDFRGGENFK